MAGIKFAKIRLSKLFGSKSEIGSRCRKGRRGGAVRFSHRLKSPPSAMLVGGDGVVLRGTTGRRKSLNFGAENQI
ncbi:hypothetical protein L2E82_01997 [Cichorium intybus]|uniref:Uncharacterized protein n=1 Tax=Cichorium intybus TaxID=13427 RepID=A0ACB9H2K7_CICIN|nr:hypothetical protein L2E82_01997 [Cichorium intybus]